LQNYLRNFYGRYPGGVLESVNFDRIADRYDVTRGGEERGRLVADDLAPHLPAGALLEIGVGTGLVAGGLAAQGRSVLGIDLSAAMLSHAARRIPGRVARADAAAIPLPDDSVDACVAVHVLHLVGEPRAVMAEVARVLRPGGRFAVVGGRAPGTATDVFQVIAAMDARLRGERRGVSEPSAVVAIAADAGLRPLAEFAIVQVGEAVTPNAAADQIAGRVWSRLWDLSAEQWASVVEPALDALRRLPDPGRPRPVAMTTPAIIFGAGGPVAG
jgi:SAM-dependent methyltransferase